MKTLQRALLIYGVSFVGAGVVSFVRGRRGAEMAMDTLLHGAIAGTALNVVGYLVLGSGEVVPVVSVPNGLAIDEDGNIQDLDAVEVSDAEPVSALANSSLPNAVNPLSSAAGSDKGTGGVGKTPKKALELLSQINPDRLFASLKENGVKIAEVPPNASVVLQDET